MAEAKTTKRQYFEQILELVAGNEELVNFVNTQIEQIDAKAAKAKEKNAEKKAEGDALAAAIFEKMTNEFQTPQAIADLFEDVSKQKVVARVKGFIDNGTVVKGVDADGKVAYKLA